MTYPKSQRYSFVWKYSVCYAIENFAVITQNFLFLVCKKSTKMKFKSVQIDVSIKYTNYTIVVVVIIFIIIIIINNIIIFIIIIIR